MGCFAYTPEVGSVLIILFEILVLVNVLNMKLNKILSLKSVFINKRNNSWLGWDEKILCYMA